MNKYINADDLTKKRYIIETHRNPFTGEESETVTGERRYVTYAEIDEMPSADVVEVTECVEKIDSMIENLKKDFPLLDFNSRYMMERGLRMAVIVMNGIVEGIYDERVNFKNE